MDIIELKSRIDKLVPGNQGFMTYGSRIYGTDYAGSDIDCLVLGDHHQEIIDSDLSLHVILEKDFTKRLRDFDVVAIECFFSPIQRLNYDYSGSIDWSKLRASFSKVSSHSWAKAGKKIDVERQYYIGKKSLFHAFRIMIFGIDLAVNGRITDFKAANKYYQMVMKNHSFHWNDYKVEFQPLFNQIHSEFKKVTSK